MMDFPAFLASGFGPEADLLPCGLVLTDAEGTILAVNATLLRWLSQPAAAVIGECSFVQLLAPPGQVYWKTHLWPQLRLQGHIDEVTLPLPDGAGGLRHCLLSAQISGEGGHIGFVLVDAGRQYLRDQEQARSGVIAQLRARWLAQIERMAGVGAFALDPETGEIEASDRVFEMLGLVPAVGLTLDQMLERFVSAKVRTAIRADLARLARTQEPLAQEAVLATPTGELRRVQLQAEGEWLGGQMVRIAGVLNDVTQFHEDQQRLWQAANIDELTGLANRRLFHRRLQTALEGGPFALVLLDLDDFNAVNDMLGADAADELLRDVAVRLAGLVGAAGVAARLGGDEFALLLPAADADAAAERLTREAQAAMAQPFEIAATRLTACIGLATFPADATDAEGLLRCARQALSEVKSVRPGSAAFLRGPLRARFDARRTAVAFVQEAARDGRIRAWYQPKVRLDSHRIVGYEALARILTPEGTISTPELWGAALEDVDCARLVDGNVLDAVLADLKRDAPRLVRVGVNFSEASLRGMDFAEQILALISARGLSPQLLELEVVETVLLGQRADVLAQGFKRLRAQGMRIALDDFGTGFASLSHLRDLPIDRIKLDKSFVLGLSGDHRNGAILRAILDLAAVLGLETVAEGVETDKAAVYLRGLGCLEGQGFRFGPAQPFEALPPPGAKL
ncbi:diguanylate cyclase (GGDEF)-like protein [Rhodobacter viridis]|uniref:Diguanylate cyclase (GGDEF)-like protein n=1 Tax=Rhodobacter viridis TaxID=1054202 RepID=A0A318U217_9RHOB|nr:EAL domain-containing protein [Rhodobacter viridis]PYF10331.1 diguanylate cyclase (GGDEF)-like protein [Rhodobacter viridis]